MAPVLLYSQGVGIHNIYTYTTDALWELYFLSQVVETHLVVPRSNVFIPDVYKNVGIKM